jgi:RNA polymerase sigma factor (TIGR02999 family)
VGVYFIGAMQFFLAVGMRAGIRRSPPEMTMSNVTQLLNSIGQGEAEAADRLLPLVYQELRKLAAAKLGHEKPGQTLQPTALVHEAYLRLVDDVGESRRDNRGHFFAAAAEAMRRILVESTRRKSRVKHGGELQRVELADHDIPIASPPEEILALDEALTRLEAEDSEAAAVVRLHFFAGLSIEDAAEALGMSRATAYRHWTYARAWLRCEIGDSEELPNS